MSKLQDGELATAFIDWVKTFELISRQVNSYADLTDGVVLIEIACDISDNKWFKNLRSDTQDNGWVSKYNRLKRFYTLIQRYYEEVNGLSVKNIDTPNLNTIAKESDLKETMKLCSLVLTMAVQSSKNAIYIEKIQSLSAKSQEGLMVAIESVIAKLGGSSDIQETQAYITDEQLIQVTAEHSKVISDKEALERAHQALMEEHTQLREKFDDLQAEKDDLKQRLNELEVSLSQSSHSNRSDFLLKTDIENLRQEISRGEMKRHETEIMLESQNALIAELTRRVEELSEQADEAAKLKDQLDEYKHAADKLRKTENVIEKYKKKLEDGADLRRTVKTLEEENRDLVQRNQEIEEEYRKVSGFRTLMEQYKGKIEDLELQNRELIDIRNKYEYEYKHMRGKIEAYEMEKARDMERIELMEERLREVELGDGERLSQISKGEQDDLDSSIVGNELTDALSGTTMTQLRLKINELERELSSWRNGKPNVDESEIIVLKNNADDANRAKAKLERELERAKREKFQTESKLARYENGTIGLESGDRTSSQELLDTKRRLSEAEHKLRQAEEKGNSTKSDPELEMKIEELEAEKDQLKRKNEELNSFLQSLEGMSDDDFKAENVSLKKQNHDRGKKIEQLKELVKTQYGTIETYKLVENSVNAERKAHEEEIKRYKQMIEEIKARAAMEQNYIISAWYDVGRRIQRDNVSFQRISPTSWLGQQRRTQEGQLKRR